MKVAITGRASAGHRSAHIKWEKITAGYDAHSGLDPTPCFNVDYRSIK
jgi:hypothetical protein